jgi:hypothetical protein
MKQCPSCGGAGCKVPCEYGENYIDPVTELLIAVDGVLMFNGNDVAKKFIYVELKKAAEKVRTHRQ